jgi:hypothetical protein
MPFQILRPDGKTWEADLMEIVDYFQSRYFRDVRPISSAAFVTSLDGPARVLPESDTIEVNSCLATFIKLCRFLVLHELINNKFYKLYGRVPDYSEEEFRKELRRLWDAGAYDDLL